MWLHRKSFFMMLCFAQIIGIFIILFGSATIQCVNITEKEIDTRSLQFGIQLNPSITQTWNEIKRKVDSIADSQAIPSLLTPVIYGKYQEYTFQIATMPTLEQATVRINPSVFPSYAVGDYITLGSYCYLITELNSGLAFDLSIQGNEVPDDVLITRIAFFYNEPPTTPQADAMQLLLLEAFPDSEIGLPETRDPLTAQFHNMTILYTFLLLLAVIINISYVQMYRFRLEKRNFVLYRIMGCTKNGIVLLCLIEVLLSSFLLYLCSIMIFHVFFKTWISTWYDAVDSLYTVPFYVLLGCAYLLLQLFILAIPLQSILIKDINISERKSL